MQLQKERRALEASRRLLEELLSKSQEEAIAKATAGNSSHATSVTFGNHNSGFQAGIINGAVSGMNFGRKWGQCFLWCLTKQHIYILDFTTSATNIHKEMGLDSHRLLT